MSRKKMMTVVGARPQIIKAAAVSRAIRQHFSEALTEVLVHTGQHYDHEMSGVFFEELEMPAPHYNLETGSGSQSAQTGLMLQGLGPLLEHEKPDAVLVYGDTNSTLAASLAAAKQHIPLVHIEAGLRSFDKTMPEEINRIVSDQCATLLFVPTAQGLQNLEREGFDLKVRGPYHLDKPGIFQCGDVMLDNALYFGKIAAQRANAFNQLDKTAVVTLHRPVNTDVAQNLQSILTALLKLADAGWELLFPVHPRTRKMLEEAALRELSDALHHHPRIQLVQPAPYLELLGWLSHCSVVITDSGGLQKEAFFMHKPCAVLRERTEWVELVDNGNAALCGADSEKIVSVVQSLAQKQSYTWPSYYGDGHAAEKILETVIRWV